MCSLPIWLTARASWKNRATTSRLPASSRWMTLSATLLADQRVLGEVHRAHAARPDLLQDAVVADGGAGRESRLTIAAPARRPELIPGDP